MHCKIRQIPKILGLCDEVVDALQPSGATLQFVITLSEDRNGGAIVNVGIPVGVTAVKVDGCTGNVDVIEIPERLTDKCEKQLILAATVDPTELDKEKKEYIVNKLTSEKLLKDTVSISFNVLQSSCVSIDAIRIHR